MKGFVLNGLSLVLITFIVSVGLTWYLNYTDKTTYLNVTYQSLIVGGSAFVTANAIIDSQNYEIATIYGIYVIFGATSLLLMYLLFIKTNPFDRIYSQSTNVVQLTSELKSPYKELFNRFSSYQKNIEPNGFILEVHKNSEKFIIPYTDKLELCEDISTNSTTEIANCWYCGELQDDIRLEGIVAKSYALKNNRLDSRNYQRGIYEAELCHKCSQNIITKINEDDTINMHIGTSDLVLGGI